MNKTRLTAYTALSITSVIWGVGAVLIKYSLNYTSPFTFLFYRFAIVGIIFLPIFIYQAKKTKLQFKDLPFLILLGFMASTLNLTLLFYGMKLTSAIEATFIGALSPILIIIGGAVFLKEEVTNLEKIGAVLAFTGSIFIIIQPILANGRLDITNLEGNIMVFLATIIWGAYSLMARKRESTKKSTPLMLTSFTFLVGFLTIIPFFLIEKLQTAEPLFWVDPHAVPGIIYMALLGSCIGFFCYNLGFSLIEASEATIFSYLTPIFAFPLAVLWLGEKIDQWFVFGAVLIFIGVFLTEYKGKVGAGSSRPIHARSSRPRRGDS